MSIPGSEKALKKSPDLQVMRLPFLHLLYVEVPKAARTNLASIFLGKVKRHEIGA